MTVHDWGTVATCWLALTIAVIAAWNLGQAAATATIEGHPYRSALLTAAAMATPVAGFIAAAYLAT